ncbi:MAG: thioredoxin family protein [Flavobacteriaceae bacterium]|nr:MAG: thioredoxin family protein [Flavobacteriaceae bacterium]
MTNVSDKQEFEKILEANRGILFYFATDSCVVGGAVEPKVRQLLDEKFDKIAFCFINMNISPEISASHQVFVEPTLLLFIDGKEYLRRSRNINMIELEDAIQRIFSLAFED